MEQIQQDSTNAERFIALANKFRDRTEYSDEILCRFIEKVIVHEVVKDADGEKSRQIDIFFSFIGNFQVPVEPVVLTPEEEKRQAQLKHRRIHEREKRTRKRQEREAAKDHGKPENAIDNRSVIRYNHIDGGGKIDYPNDDDAKEYEHVPSGPDQRLAEDDSH